MAREPRAACVASQASDADSVSLVTWLRTAPFRRAPWLLFRQPVLLGAVGGTALILGLVASMTPMFESSAASAALQRQLADRCQSTVAPTIPVFLEAVGPSASLADQLDQNRRVLAAATASDPVFGPPQLVLKGAVVDLTTADRTETSEAQVMGLEDFRDHITLVAGGTGDGAYIDQRTAESLGVGPGDTISGQIKGFSSRGGDSQTPLTVSGVYENLNDRYIDPYWCAYEDLLAPSSTLGDLPPPLLIVDPNSVVTNPDLFALLLGSDGPDLGTWQIPVKLSGLTVTAAEHAAQTIEEAAEGLPALSEQVSGQPWPNGLEVSLTSDLLDVAKRVVAQSDALDTSIVPLAVVVLLAAVGLIGMAGSYWVDRRRAELVRLEMSGLSPFGSGVKAVLELFLPVLLGALCGWAVANLLIQGVGPSPDIEGYARRDGLTAALAATAVGLIVAGAVVMGRRAIGHRRSAATRRLGLRWPLLALAVAASILVRVSIGGQAVTLGESVVVGSVDPLVILFPVLVLISAALAVSELVTMARPLIERAGARTNAAYLASRRLLSEPAVALTLLVAAVVPVAILVYAEALGRSATVSVEAKGKTSVGSDVATVLYRVEEIPPVLAHNSTIVIKMANVDLDNEIVDVLAVDPDTFLTGGFWLDGFSSRSIGAILKTVSEPPHDGALVAIVANTPVTSGTVKTDAGDLHVDVVASIADFPGETRDRPLLLVGRQQLSDLLASDSGRIRGSRYLLWTKGLDQNAIDQALLDAGVGFAFSTPANSTLDQLKFAVIIWSFDFLRLYAVLAGLIVIASILIYVDTRQRGRNLSYALARRMGLTRAAHLRAGYMEIGSLVLVGSIVGVGVGEWTARSLYLALDPLPNTPPAPQWVSTIDIALIAVAVGVLVAVVSVLMAQRTADRADVSELLRHGN